MDVENRIALRTVDAAHGYFPEMQRHMLGWFRKWLLGVGSGEPADVPAVRDLPESRLMCFPKTSRPSRVKSLIEYVSLRSRAVKADMLAARTLNRSKKRRDLARILRVPAAGIVPAIGSVVKGVERGCRVEKFTLESEPDILIPCVLIIPAGQPMSTIVIAAHPDGKDAALKQPESLKALQEGKALCLVDVRETGETAWDPPVAQCRNAARAALWLGRTMIGNWVHDLCAARAALGRRMPRVRYELLGFREAALAALASAALRRGFNQVSVVEMLSSYVLRGAPPVQAFSIFVPGLLAWGDVSLMAAMVDCPLKATSLVHPSGLPLSKQGASAWSREVRKLRDALRADRAHDKCNFQYPASALRAEGNEHGRNTGEWERAGKTAEGSAQRETTERPGGMKVACREAAQRAQPQGCGAATGSERVKVPWLQRQRPCRAVRPL
jgi:hypothetical protein